MRAQRESEYWGEELARISAQLDDLKVRSDEEFQALHSLLDAQVADLQAILRKIETHMHAMRPEEYARRVAAQIEELRAKGDAAYERLQANTWSSTDLTQSPHP